MELKIVRRYMHYQYLRNIVINVELNWSMIIFLMNI